MYKTILKCYLKTNFYTTRDNRFTLFNQYMFVDIRKTSKLQQYHFIYYILVRKGKIVSKVLIFRFLNLLYIFFINDINNF